MGNVNWVRNNECYQLMVPTSYDSVVTSSGGTLIGCSGVGYNTDLGSSTEYSSVMGKTVTYQVYGTNSFQKKLPFENVHNETTSAPTAPATQPTPGNLTIPQMKDIIDTC